MSKIVALEITPHAIRGAEVSGYRSKKPKLLRTGQLKLDEGIAGESSVQDKEGLSDALNRLWKEAGFTTKLVALIVSGRRFIVRAHTTAQTSQETLRQILPLEAPGAFPDQVSNLLFDFYPTHALEGKDAGKTEGLVISSPSEPISELAFALKRSKLELEYVDFTPVAVTRWIGKNREEQNYALVNIREDSTDIASVSNGMPKNIRVVSKGLSTNRRKFPRNTKRTSGIGGSPLLRRDVQGDNAVQVLIQDITMTVRAQIEESSLELEVIFISGPRAEDPELKIALEDNFGLPVITLSIEEGAAATDEEQNMKPSFDEFVAMCGGMR